ncbi:MAG: MOSC domain-containing protein [Planctomycetota bacterium]
MCKASVEGAVQLGMRALEGDGCADLVHHGLEDQAVCVMPLEHYAWWREELQREQDTFPLGSFGDNFTVVGMTEEHVHVGDVWSIGSAEVVVTKPRHPCSTLNKVWGRNDFAALMGRKGLTGWYLQVRKPGLVTAGDVIHLLHRDPQAPTIAAAWAAKRRKANS